MNTEKAVSESPQDEAYHKYVVDGHSVNDLIIWFRSELLVHPREKEKYDHYDDATLENETRRIELLARKMRKVRRSE